MALRTPILDDRSYAQLRDELVARIPVYAPEWTDHNASDPGIALIELFAFVAENVLYRFNQVPDATRMAFLDLLDVPQRPAAAATGIVTFTTKKLTSPLVERQTVVFAGKVPFETFDEVTVLPLEAHAAVRVAEALPTGVEVREHVSRVSAAIGQSIEDVTTYRTQFGAFEPSKPGGDVLDPSTGTVDGTLWVALLADQPANVAAARAALAGARLSIGVVRAEEAPPMADVDACPGGAGAPPTPATEWQVSTVLANTESADAEHPDPQWFAIEVESDSTAGLTRTGVVGLRFPAASDDIGVFAPEDPEATGSGDQPPLVEDDSLGERVVCWVRAFRPDGTALTALEWVGSNAARVEQSETAGAEFLGAGNGQPRQDLRLVDNSVIGDDLVLEVEEAGPRWVRWQIVEDFNGSGIDSRDAVLDRAAGTVSCGDGLRGRVFQIGERVRVVRYRHGGGVAGNVAAGAITKVDVVDVKVTNPLATQGGAEAETTAQAVERLPAEVRRHDRAVTSADFRELALQTPGAGIARAESLGLFSPRNPEMEMPGAVTVVVWPANDLRHPGAPRPTRSQLDAVCRYLDERRLITTELFVVPPTYRRLNVSVGISVKPGYGTEAVRRWVELLLRQYLSPLPPYGPEGAGWPLGRRVYGPELEAAALQVEGVEYLEGLRIAVPAADGNGWTEPQIPLVLLEKYEVPQLMSISVVPGAAADPTKGPPTAPPLPGPAVPVRAPLEVC